MLVEHSASEGVTVLRFCELFLEYHRRKGSQLVRQNTIDLECKRSTLRVQALRWNISPEVAQQMRQSEKQADKYALLLTIGLV